MPPCNDLLAAGADQLPAGSWHGCGAVCSFCAGTDSASDALPVFVMAMIGSSESVSDFMQERCVEFFDIVACQQMFRNGNLLACVVTAAAALPCIVQTEPPVLQIESIQLRPGMLFGNYPRRGGQPNCSATYFHAQLVPR